MSKSFVEFSLVVGCANECKYCPQDNHLKAYTGNKMLSMDDYMFMVDKLPKSTISIAGFSEPFINQSCTDMIEYAVKMGHAVIIYTTLMGITIEQYERIRKSYGVRAIVVHLPDKEENTKINITDEYRKILKHVVQNPPGQWCNMEWSVHGSSVHSDIVDIINIRPIYRIHDRAGQLKTDDKSVQKVHWESGKIRCNNGFATKESGVILPNGDVVFCCMDFSLDYRIGNLLEQSWEEIMKSPTRKLLIEDRKTGEHNLMCRYCSEACQDYNV